VIYNSAGEILDYFSNPYILYKSDATAYSGRQWKVYNYYTEEDQKHYSPTVIKNTIKDSNKIDWYLQPLSFYIEGACERVCICAVDSAESNNPNIYWSQPILIMQNRYPSAMLNQWDGSLTIGGTDGGTILAPRMAAGMKNDDNTFSGVVLGNWGSTNSDNSLTSGDTGLYGFDHGD
jgi:hypothetical protein